MSPLHQPLVSGHIWRTMHSRTTLELCFKLLTINKIPLPEDKEIQYTYIYKPIIHWPRLNSQKDTETLQWTKPMFSSSYCNTSCANTLDPFHVSLLITTYTNILQLPPSFRQSSFSASWMLGPTKGAQEKHEQVFCMERSVAGRVC